MRIGILARRAGVSASCIRFYERRGLVPAAPRLASGYRDYDDRALAIVAFVTRARSLGFGLEAIGAHLRSPDDGARKARLIEMLNAMIGDVDEAMRGLADRRTTLSDLIAEATAQQAANL